MIFPKLAKPEGKTPRKPRGLAWLIGLHFAVLSGVVSANVLVIPVFHALGAPPVFAMIWFAQLGLAACWATWAGGPWWLRYAAPSIAILACAVFVHPIMAWENETLGMFLSNHLRVVPAVHLLLFPTRWLGWRWQFQDQVDGATGRSDARQFRLTHLLMLLAAWSALLGYLRWGNDGGLYESVLMVARSALFALMVVPVAWLAIARHRKWWLVSVILVALFVAVWERMPQTDIHHLLDLELERFTVIAIWTLISMGLLYLFGLRGSTSLQSVTEPNQTLSHV